MQQSNMTVGVDYLALNARVTLMEKHVPLPAPERGVGVRVRVAEGNSAGAERVITARRVRHTWDREQTIRAERAALNDVADRLNRLLAPILGHERAAFVCAGNVHVVIDPDAASVLANHLEFGAADTGDNDPLKQLFEAA